MTHWPDDDYRVVADGAAYVEGVASEELHAFCLQFDRLKFVIRTEELDEPWTLIRSILGRLRFRLLGLPVPFGSDEMGIADTRRSIESILQQIGVGDANRQVVIATLESLIPLESTELPNPLAETVVEILTTGEPDDRGVVLLNPEWEKPAEAWIGRRLEGVRIWRSNDAGSIPIHQLLVLPGRPQYFARYGETTNAFLTSPRAESTCFVQFDFLGLPKPVPGLLAGGTSTVTRPIRGGFQVPAMVIDAVDDGLADFDWNSVEYRYKGRGSDVDELVDSRGVTFSDDSYTFVLESEESTVQVARSNPRGKITLDSKSVSDLEVGDVLVLRTGGSDAGHIRDLADLKFDAARHRDLIARWKTEVRSAIDRVGGPANARRALSGNARAARNLSYWVTPQAIKPRERVDFDDVSDFAGMHRTESEKVWKAMTNVFDAHRDAGMLIREQLENGLEDRSLESIEDVDYVEVELEGFGTLRAARVTRIAPDSTIVPHRWIGVINQRGDD